MEIGDIVEVGDIVEAGDIVEGIIEASVLAPAQTSNFNALEMQLTCFPPMYMFRRKVECVVLCYFKCVTVCNTFFNHVPCLRAGPVHNDFTIVAEARYVRVVLN